MSSQYNTRQITAAYCFEIVTEPAAIEMVTKHAIFPEANTLRHSNVEEWSHEKDGHPLTKGDL